MNDCLFCTIANQDPKHQIIWQNEFAVAFHNIHPQTPVHVLVVPKKHINILDELDDVELAGQLLMAVREVAEATGVKGAYRVKINNGKPVGMVIEHLHIHIMGGKEMPDN